MKRVIGLILVIAPLVILTVSIITLITTSPLDSGNIPLIDNFAFKQVLFALTGILFATLVAKLDIDYLRVPAIVMFFFTLSVFSLVLVLILPRSVANTHRWFVIGPFTIQPSELIKPLYFLIIAYILTSKHSSQLKTVMFLSATLPIWLLIFLEPDAGTTLFYITITLLVLLIWASKWSFIRNGLLIFFIAAILLIVGIFWHAWYTVFLVIIFLFVIKDLKAWLTFASFALASLLLIGLVIASWRFNILRPYQKQRLEPFIQAYKTGGLKGVFQMQQDPNSHVRQARIAIGSAGLLGKGPWQGTQSRLRFLPEYTTDFIYAAFVEEFGLVGGVVVIFIYIIWLLAIFVEILGRKQEYYFLLLLFIALGMSFQIIVNIGMNLGILPTKGMPLPFFSYGGSSLISAFIQLGLLYSIHRK